MEYTMNLTAALIQSVIPEAHCFGASRPFHGISIDSRSVSEEGTFVALTGQTHDGHDFVADAIKRGARSLIIRQDRQDCLEAVDARVKDDIAVAVVPDTYTALYQLAATWRQQFHIPIIGVTGSVGKTSTKEMLANVLRTAGYSCFASYGNQNTQLGTALNILRLGEHHDIAVFEVAARRRGDIAQRVDMLRPTTGIITSVAHSHLAGIGSIYDIAAEKRQLFTYFQSDNIGIINGDISILSSISYAHPVIRFGCKTTNQVQARKLQMSGHQSRFVLKLYGRRHQVAMPTGHTGHVMNALACAATACFLGVSDADIIRGIQEPVYIPGRYRPQYIGKSYGTLVDDCYNANPASMKEALLAFDRLDVQGQKIAVIGDMEQLGVNTSFWHRQIGRVLRKTPSIQHVVLVGRYVHWIEETLPEHVTAHHVSDWQQAHAYVEQQQLQDGALLVKGSRSIGLENLVNAVSYVSAT